MSGPLKLLRALVLGTLVLIVVAIAVGFLLPESVHVERSTHIQASPQRVFAAVNGFEEFNRWSPWAQLDPQTRYDREGPPQGLGARQAWHSELRSVGSGSQEIIESVPYERVRMQLRFTGFDSDNVSTFLIAPEAGGTRLTWAYDTQLGSNLLGRYFGLMLDGMLGKDYEAGLANLKRLLESEAGDPAAP